MKPTPYEIDIALARALALSTPGLRIQYLAKKHGWILEASEESAKLHEGIGLVNPPKYIWPFLLSELKSLASMNENFRMFSIPDCSKMVQENWKTSSFENIGVFANRHVLIQNARVPFRLPVSREKKFAIMVRKAHDHSRLDTLIQKMAFQYYPDEPDYTRSLNLLRSMTDNSATDFIEFSLSKNNMIIGGVALSHYNIFCYPFYNFIEKGYRGKGYFYPILMLFQKIALREDVRYIIGDIFHYSMRPSLKRIYEHLGAKSIYSRCYYSMDASSTS